jgi:superfamily II DNA or RNA helicase
MLRKHQRQFKQAVEGIKEGLGIDTLWCHVTPGGGKSLLPVLAGNLITSGLADKLIWIAPRLSLIDQAEREFINPHFRQKLNHRLQIRSSTNEINPCRGTHGFATTYNAVGLDEGILIDEFRRRRYILVMDEFHHVANDSLWHEKIQPLWDLACFRVPMTGTLERGEGSRIAFLPYREGWQQARPTLPQTTPDFAIRYTRTDALRERAIIPLKFHLADGQASWETDTGKTINVASIDRVDDQKASQAVYTALKTGFADDLLYDGLAHWQEHRKEDRNAKCLVVCSDIKHAERHMEGLNKRGMQRVAIATSADSTDALKAINAMKRDQVDCLVTVAMAYEGLSIPAVSHIICLTRVRSTPWIEQMTARANRINPALPYEVQVGHVFAPADPLFKEIVGKIEQEQGCIVAAERQGPGGESGRQSELFPGEEKAPGNITPLSSQATGSREIFLGAGYEGSTLFEEQTASELEAGLLSQIESHIRQFAFQNRFNPKRINGELFTAMGKPRREMTVPELERCLAHVRAQYPLWPVRGTGIPRVATKAKAVNVGWR